MQRPFRLASSLALVFLVGYASGAEPVVRPTVEHYAFIQNGERTGTMTVTAAGARVDVDW